MQSSARWRTATVLRGWDIVFSLVIRGATRQTVPLTVSMMNDGGECARLLLFPTQTDFEKAWSATCRRFENVGKRERRKPREADAHSPGALVNSRRGGVRRCLRSPHWLPPLFFLRLCLRLRLGLRPTLFRRDRLHDLPVNRRQRQAVRVPRLGA